MITFTGDPIYIGNKNIFDNSTELLLDCMYRNDGSVVAIMYAFSSGSEVGRFETAYSSGEVDGESLTETDTSAMFNEAVHQLEKARLEALNPTNTFTITL